MQKLQTESLENEDIPETLFGGNFLFQRDTLGEDSPFEAAAEALGFTTVRYPGGSVTENHFDISNPDSLRSYDPDIDDYRDLVPLSEFLEYAESSDLSVQIVIPTMHSLGTEEDVNGDRFSAVDEDELAQFVTDVIGGEYGDAEIISFEIGNEYWGSQMSSVEYGRVSSKVAEVISRTLETLDDQYPGSKDIGVVVQVGTNYKYARLDDKYSHIEDGEEIIEAIELDYDIELDNDTLHGNGKVDWVHVNEQLIQSEVEDQLNDGAITGVVTHLYSREPVIEGSGERPLAWLTDHWLDDYPDLDVYVSEWNQRGNTEALDQYDYGLYQAAEILDLVETMHEYSTDVAHVWPTIQWTDNALIRGFEFDELTPAGEMYGLMSSELIGTKPIKFASSEEGEHEALLNDGKVELHGFASEEKLVMFLTSKSDEVEITDVDLSGLIDGYDSASGVQIGVEEGDDPGYVNSTAEVENLEQDDFLEGTELSAVLGAYEILRVVVEAPNWTEEMTDFLSGSTGDGDDGATPTDPIDDGGDDGGDTPIIPTVPIDDESPSPEDDPDAIDDDNEDFGDLVWLLLLPVAGLAMGFGL